MPPDAGVGERARRPPGGIPGDLGRVAEIKSTTDVDERLQRDLARRDPEDQHEGLAILKDPKAAE